MFTVLVIIALATNFISGKVSRWSLVLVTAGGLANCIDRVIYGYVQDMFKVELFNFAIFNVADVFITVFAIVFVLAMIFEKPEDDDLEDEEFEDDEDEEDASPRPSLRDKLSAAEQAASVWKQRYDSIHEKYEALKKKVQPYLTALKAAPEKVRAFIYDVLAHERENAERKHPAHSQGRDMEI